MTKEQIYRKALERIVARAEYRMSHEVSDDVVAIAREALAAEPTAVLVPHAYSCTECFTDAGQLHRPGCRFIEIDARNAENRPVAQDPRNASLTGDQVAAGHSWPSNPPNGYCLKRYSGPNPVTPNCDCTNGVCRHPERTGASR